MAGANYMGGRRNATKARVRDSDGRSQRSHFGKQRLTVLAQGLGRALAPRDASSRGREEVLRAGISLAHARAKDDSSTIEAEEPLARIYPAYNHHPSTPPRKQKKSESPTSHSSVSESSRRSAVLRELDTSEPFFMRAEINRLLKHPDFAGLSLAGGNHTGPTGHQMSQAHFDVTNRSPAKKNTETNVPTVERRALSRDSLPDVDEHSDWPLRTSTHEASTSPSHQGLTMAEQWNERDPEGDVEFEPMSFDDDSDIVSSGAQEDSGFAEYAVENWDVHLANLSDVPEYHSSDSSCGRPHIVARDLGSPSENLPANGFAYVNYPGGFADNASSSFYTADPSFISDFDHTLNTSISFQFSPRSLRILDHHPAGHETLRRTSPRSGIQSASSDISAMIEPPESESLIEEKLVDTLDGHLFENENPWKAIHIRLGISPPSSASSSTGSTFPRLLDELRSNMNRCGVGYTEPRSAIDEPEQFPSSSSPENTLRSHLVVEDEQHPSDPVYSGPAMTPPAAADILSQWTDLAASPAHSEILLRCEELLDVTMPPDQDRTASTPPSEQAEAPGGLRTDPAAAPLQPTTASDVNAITTQDMDRISCSIVKHAEPEEEARLIAGPSLFSDEFEEE